MKPHLFKPGESGNLNGRGKGNANKVTKQTRAMIANLVESGLSTAEADLKSLDPKDRLIILEKLIGYIIPKQREIKLTNPYEEYSEQELLQVIEDKMKIIKAA